MKVKTASIKGDNIILSEMYPALMQDLAAGCFTIFKPDNSILCNNRVSLWFLVKILIKHGYELV